MNRNALRRDGNLQQDRGIENVIAAPLHARPASVQIGLRLTSPAVKGRMRSLPQRAPGEREATVASTVRHTAAILRHKLPAPVLAMHITIAADSVTALRRAVIEHFGAQLAYMRIQSIDHGKKMRVCLCLTAPIAESVMAAIMRGLPCAEFGRFAHS